MKKKNGAVEQFADKIKAQIYMFNSSKDFIN